MSVLIITYAHTNAEKDYTPFFDAIKKSADRWWHYMDTTWIIETGLSADSFAKTSFSRILSEPTGFWSPR